jgi:hypothetical protein
VGPFCRDVLPRAAAEKSLLASELRPTISEPGLCFPLFSGRCGVLADLSTGPSTPSPTYRRYPLRGIRVGFTLIASACLLSRTPFWARADRSRAAIRRAWPGPYLPLYFVNTQTTVTKPTSAITVRTERAEIHRRRSTD